MSGIAGILRFDRQTPTRRELERVANAMHQYGPDKSGITIQQNIGLVHTLMRMTPEDRFDHQPYRSTSGAIITADLRIDNRDELLTRIGVPRGAAIEWADSRLLLFAWEKLGARLFPLLRGPFAVAIWNPETRSLLLARDHLGLNVVMWHRSEKFFAFATMPNAIFAIENVARQLCEEKIADFLVLNHSNASTTVYQNIFRLPPGHLMHVTEQSECTVERYWSPDDIKPIRLSSDSAYAEGLRECLDGAVRRQMRSIHRVGCLLSGGLDSSSIAALAAQALAEKGQKLVAFTGVPREGFSGPVQSGSYADETPFVEAIKNKIANIETNYIRNDEYDDFEHLERFFNAFNGPVRNPMNFGWMLGLLRCAAKQGCRVLLGGLYGNYTVSWDGWSQSASQLLHGRLSLAYRQWQLYYSSTPYSRWESIKNLFVTPLLPLSIGDWIDRRRNPNRLGPWQDHSSIQKEFAVAMNVDRRGHKIGHDFLYRPRRDERIQGLAQVDYLGDWQAAEKAVTHVEVRDPTADLDVVSYCFGIPPEQYLAEGIDRSLIRRAMWGLVPEAILTNRSRGAQAADWYEKVGRKRAELARQIAELSRSALVRKIIDLSRLESAIENWPDEGWEKAEVFREYNLALTRGFASAMFLRWFESTN